MTQTMAEAPGIAPEDHIQPIVPEISKQSDDDLYLQLSKWFKADEAHSAEWRKQAREDYAFAAGDQWTAEEKAVLTETDRVPITFNTTLTMIRAVAGMEIGSRHDTVFIPSSGAAGVVKKNELLSSASRWMDETSDAEDNQSAAFQDTLTCGMGWTEQAIGWDENPDGSYIEPRINPLEMFWDHKAREKNLQDARRIWHVRSDIDIAEARGMFPGEDDENLNCSWPSGRNDSGDPKAVEERLKRHENSSGAPEENTVTIVRVQWWEHEKYWRVQHPELPDGQGGMSPGKVLSLDAKQLAGYKKVMREQFGIDPKQVRTVEQRRRVYKQAYLGAKILGEVTDCPCPTHFTINCVTGEPDRNKGTWFGLVSIVRDPQKWSNKWLMQTQKILDTTAKGGILAEKGAFADERHAEENYAKTDAVVLMTKGAIAEGRIMAKPGQGMPSGYIQLLEFAMAAQRNTTGINMELMGLRDTNQPGILEAQRKQAGMTILATLFDSQKRYRKRVGRVRLYYIQEYFADGRMIRISGDDGDQQYVPLMKDKVAGNHDVIIDDAPASPNQKQATWGALQTILPAMKGMITPPVLLKLLRYSPLPSKLLDELDELANKPQPAQQALMQLEHAGAEAKVDLDKAKAEQARAAAMRAFVDAGLTVAQAQQQPAMIDANGLPVQQEPPVEPTTDAPAPMGLLGIG